MSASPIAGSDGLVGRVERSLPDYVEFVYALVLVWGFGDVVSTYVAVSAVGGVAMEANPWMRLLLATEPLLVLAVKAAVVVNNLAIGIAALA